MVFFSNHKHPSKPAADEAGGKDELPDEQKQAAEGLKAAVQTSGQPGAATSPAGGVLCPAKHAAKKHETGTHFWSAYIPGIEKYAAEEHAGNYVIVDRATGEKQWESMPIYVRAGMTLLFDTGGDRILGFKYIEHLLVDQSVKQGKLFDAETGAYEHIVSFVQTYGLEDSLSQLAQPDLKAYKTFNSFFYRALKPDARPVAGAGDPNILVSAADCRLTVWEDVSAATQVWIKGRQFSVQHLVHDDTFMSNPAYADGCSLAIFRLAPQDYHRWHQPLTSTLGQRWPISGSLYTVNPMAVQNPAVDVFTANKRDIQILNVSDGADGQSVPVALVSIGAMLVGSIAHSHQEGDTVEKGAELGYFAYGGSTCILILPKKLYKFDNDLLKNSNGGLETVVKVGEQIGTRRT